MQRSCSKRMLTRISQKSRRHLDRLLPQTGDEEKTTTRPVRAFTLTSSPAEKVIPPAENVVRNVMKPCTSFAMKSVRKYIPAQVVVNRYIRPQYSCPCCEKVFSGKMPAHILPKSAVEPSVIAQVVISKYTDHLPCIASSISSRMGWSSPSVQWRIWSVLPARTGPAGKIVTPRASDTGCYSCR